MPLSYQITKSELTTTYFIGVMMISFLVDVFVDLFYQNYKKGQCIFAWVGLCVKDALKLSNFILILRGFYLKTDVLFNTRLVLCIQTGHTTTFVKIFQTALFIKVLIIILLTFQSVYWYLRNKRTNSFLNSFTILDVSERILYLYGVNFFGLKTSHLNPGYLHSISLFGKRTFLTTFVL